MEEDTNPTDPETNDEEEADQEAPTPDGEAVVPADDSEQEASNGDT